MNPLLLSILLLAAAASPLLAQPAVADRLAAVVEEEVITLSDVLWAVRYKRLEAPDGERRRREFLRSQLEQIIDEKVIAKEAERTPGIDISKEAVSRQLERFRQRFESEGDFQRELDRMEMGLPDLRSLIRRQLAVLRFLELRFEPFIIVLPEEIRDYYEKRLVPELRRQNVPVPDMGLFEEEIRQILSTEKTNQEIERWVREQRQKSDVTVLLGREHEHYSNLPPELFSKEKIKPLGKGTGNL